MICCAIGVIFTELCTAWKLSKYGVISGPYLPVFGLNTGKYRPEITLHLDTFHVVWDYTINHNENEDKNRSHRYDINKPRSRHENKELYIRTASSWWCLYVLV